MGIMDRFYAGRRSYSIPFICGVTVAGGMLIAIALILFGLRIWIDHL